MDSSKRKRPGGDDQRRCHPSKPSAAEADTPVTDNDVEEFFSIVRRMRESKRSSAAAAGRNLSGAVTGHSGAAEPRWTHAFALEDFVGPDVAQDGADCSDSAAEERTAVALCLDLNADPDPEGLAELTPRSENTTARFTRVPPLVVLLGAWTFSEGATSRIQQRAPKYDSVRSTPCAVND